MVKVIGIVTGLEVEDLSKRAGVPNLYTRMTVRVEKSDDERLAGHVTLQKRGAASVPIGTRVELTLRVPESWSPGGDAPLVLISHHVVE